MTAPDPDLYRPGDQFPNLALPGPGGVVVNLNGQVFAGRAVVLWLTGPEPGADVLARLDESREALAAVEALVFAVAVGGQPGPAGDGEDMPRLLFDPDGRLARAVGLDRRGGVVMDANRRLAAVFAADAFDEAVALCQRLYEDSAPETIAIQAPVLLLPGVLEPELCERLIGFWEQGEKMRDAVADSQYGVGHQKATLKKRVDVLVDDAELKRLLTQRLERRVLHELSKAYGCEARHMEAFRIGCYDAASGGYFNRHRDNATPHTGHRKFAITINLNDDYEGGALRFAEYGRQVYSPAAGGAVVFSCGLLHEAEPVTRGRRFGMFGFFYDEAGRERLREMAAREPGGTG